MLSYNPNADNNKSASVLFEVKKMKLRLNSLQYLAIGFALIILTGAFLLWLPVANHVGLSFLDALLTATSATCVTGLVATDTATSFTLFGQIVIILLIQIGGLGFMMVGILFSMLMRRRIGLRQRLYMRDSIGSPYVSGIVRMTKHVLMAVAVIEGSGAIILSTQFVPRFGLAMGIWCGIFHAISSFCNAGFDLLGTISPYCSLVPYQSNPVVIITIGSLIILGGLGFFLWNDIGQKKLHFSKYSLHTKIMLVGTFILVFGGAGLFLITERDAAFKGMDTGTRLLSAFFQSVTARTAGYNSCDQAAMSSAGALLTIILMFVGAGPGSTGGGVKVTNVAVLFFGVRAKILNRKGVSTFKRTIDDESSETASLNVTLYLILAITGSMIVCLQGFSIRDSFYEVFSAIGTVGLTMGITRSLNVLSKLVIICLMYLGRVGSLSVAIAVMPHRDTTSHMKFPTEKIIL